MPGPWKAWKTKDGFPTLSTVPWKSRKKREIPTFPPPGFTAMEKWKTKSRFPTFPQPLATMIPVLSLKIKNQRKEAGRYAATSFPIRFHAHPSIGKCSDETLHDAVVESQHVGSRVIHNVIAQYLLFVLGKSVQSLNNGFVVAALAPRPLDRSETPQRGIYGQECRRQYDRKPEREAITFARTRSGRCV